MRSVLRRLLWLGPALVSITMLTFGALTLSLRVDNDAEGLPLFFNAEPGALEPHARRALALIAASPESTGEAHAELGRLGGATLPYVLPALDSLTPEGRARVVRALRPVATRMGLELDPSWEPNREVLFWARFWEEHSIDYRPTVARRAVLRLVQKSTALRDAEVRQLDTYALEELMRQMAPVEAVADIDRVRRLSVIALDMLGGPPSSKGVWVVPVEGGLDEARAVAATWADWWGLHRTFYLTYSGTERIAAMLRDTRYGSWVAQAVRHDLGLLQDGRPVGQVLRDGAPVSAALLASGIAGAYGMAALGGLSPALARRRALRWLGFGFLLRAALPVTVLVAVAAWAFGPAAQHVWVGALAMVLSGAPLSALHRPVRFEAGEPGYVRTLESLGAQRWRVALASLRLSSAAIVVQVGAQLSALITLTFVVEYALGLSGLGATTILALQRPDLDWLMAITICTALFVGLLQVLSDLLLGWLEPRWRG
ncbi:MAG TPA: ABC transporter permease subunit, partial [Polyangiaceae bacterium]|nr:ABC transporter permease subunit [Polyangiaceae bacterium]